MTDTEMSAAIKRAQKRTETPAEGLGGDADEARAILANGGQPKGDGKGHVPAADEATRTMPDPSPSSSGSEGQREIVENDLETHANASRSELQGEGQLSNADKGRKHVADTLQPASSGRLIRPNPPEGYDSTLAARRALEAAHDDVDEATEILLAEAQGDPELAAEILARGCRWAVMDSVRNRRREIWNGGGLRSAPEDFDRPAYGNATARKAQVQALAASNLLAFTLPGGRALGEARRAQVDEAARFYRMQALGYGEKQRWLELIMAKLPDANTPVGKVFDNAALQALRLEAVNKDAA